MTSRKSPSKVSTSRETDTEFLLKAQLPAVKREDVHVTYDDGMLTISGERKQETEQKGEKFHRIESFHGASIAENRALWMSLLKRPSSIAMASASRTASDTAFP